MGRTSNDLRLCGIVALMLISAFHSYRPTATIPDGQLIRVHFAPRRDISVTGRNGTQFRVLDIQMLEGEVTSVHGDSVDLSLRGLRGADGYLPASAYRGGRTTIVRGPESTLELRSFSGSKTAALVTGVALGSLAAAALVFVIGMSSIE